MANTVTITVDADTKTAEKNVKGMGAKFSTAMKGVAMAAGGLTLAAGAAAKLGQEYQEATNTIAAGTGASGEQLEGLTQSFKDIWATVPQDAAEVATAIADVNTELGLEGRFLEDATMQFLTASRVMGEDLQPLIKSVSDALVGFGEDTDNASYTLDALMAASQAAGVPMTKLADTVVTFGPQLQTLGLDMFESIALITNMEKAGLSATKMMPGLNTAIKKLASEGVTDIAGGLEEMIRDIEEADSKSMALALATDAFGAGAGIRFVDAIDKGVFSLDEMVLTMDDAFGRTTELGKSTLTMSDKFDILKNRVKATLSPIGNFATALGPLVIMIPAMSTAVAALGSTQIITTAATYAQAAAMAVLNVAMGPIGLIVLGIVAAIVAAIAIFKNWDKIVDTFRKTWDTVWRAVKSIFDTVMGAIETAFNSKLAWLLPGGALIKGLLLLKDNWDTIWNGMKTTVSLVVDGIKGYVNLLISALNLMIRGANKISIEVPKWVPGIGGKGWSLNIPQIPSLAAGGIVTRPTLAMIGERGPEAVVPLGARGAMGGITINILGPTYGFDDFERKVSEAIRDGVRRGGFGDILAIA